MSLPSYLLDPLHEELTRQGAKVVSVGACGASAGDWLKTVTVPCGALKIGAGKATMKGSDASTTPITELVGQYKPDLIIFVIGDTMASYGKPFPQAWAWQGVSSLTKAVSGTKTACLWVGPAWGSAGGKYGKTNDRVKFMSNFLANNVAPCSYVNSLSFSKEGEWPTIDGQHLTPAAYKQWAHGISQAAIAAPAILAKKP